MKKLPDSFNLSDDFPRSSIEEWKKLVEKDLKGIPFVKKLITKTYEGIDISPIYTADDIKNLPLINNYPGFHNFVRASAVSGYRIKPWYINQELPYSSPQEYNKALKKGLERGQNAVNITLDLPSMHGQNLDSDIAGFSGHRGMSVFYTEDFNEAFKGIGIAGFPVMIDCGYSPYPLFPLFMSYLDSANIEPEKVKAYFLSDPVGFCLRFGSIQGMNLDNVFDEISAALRWVSGNGLNFRLIGCSGRSYADSGADSVQELGYTMASAIEYLRYLTNRGLETDVIANQFVFTFGTGSDYFMEIAKLRASRIIWSNIISNFGGNTEKLEPFVHSAGSSYNKTKLDKYVNMLRAVTETFSAVVGGADSVQTSHFDDTICLPDEFSRRIARNTQIILREESHLDNVIDPAGGSYYVESLTAQLASKSWDLIREIEKNGGTVTALKNGIPQSEVTRLNARKLEDVSKRKKVIVGSNFYADIKEDEPGKTVINSADSNGKKDSIAKDRNAGKKSTYKQHISMLETEKNSDRRIQIMIDAFTAGASSGIVMKAVRKYSSNFSVGPLPAVRASEVFEELRIRAFDFKRANKKLPQVFLITMGPLKQHKPRADYSRGFLEAGGFEVVYEKGFGTAQEAAESAVKNGSDVMVICSTDETYPELVPEIVSAVRIRNNKAVILLAGYPKEQIDEHKKSGIDDFIFLGCDAGKVLNGIFDRLTAKNGVQK